MALYFAVKEKFDENGVIYAIDPFKLNNMFWNESVIYGGYGGENNIIESLFIGPYSNSMDYINRVAAINPTQNNLRMLLQQSEFTLHGSQKPLEDYDGIEDCLFKFVIPAKAKDLFVTALDLLSINESTIFPELEHLASYINSKHIIQESGEQSLE